MSKTLKAEMGRVMDPELADATKTARMTPDRGSIAARAYERWKQRGFPEGSSEEDWFHAERELEMGEAEEIEAA